MTTAPVRPTRTLAIAFTVYGEPIPQGSMVALTSRNPGHGQRPMLKASNEKDLKPWRRAVTAAAKAAIAQSPSARRPLLDGPLVVRAVFTFEQPKTVRRSMPCVRPDADKLLRACFDSCTEADLWADDGRVVEALTRKVYVGHDPEALPRPGVRIAVWTISEAAQPTLDGAA
jgi:Holliday junction resolvase RusA-like endonuclease